MKPSEFRERLQRSIPRPASWQFVCDGLPFNSEILLIGANPTRTTHKPFWKTYWTDEAGLNKRKLLADLEAVNGKLTNTRKRIEALRRAVDVPFLDTNVYARHTTRERDLRPEEIEEAALLGWMIESIRPRLVVAHGLRVLEFFRRRHPGLTGEKLRVQDADIEGIPFKFLYCTHLSCIGRTEFEALVGILGGLNRRD